MTRLCVNQSSCPSPYLYADNFSRQCVTNCPQSQNTFGDITTNACVSDCPWTTTTDYYTYRDPSTQNCVTQCPLNPSYYRYNVTPPRCISTCPFPYFAVESTRMCDFSCPNNFYQDPVSRKCVSKCPQDPNPTYYYSNTSDTYCV